MHLNPITRTPSIAAVMIAVFALFASASPVAMHVADAAAPGPAHAAVLAPGDSAFWDGPKTGSVVFTQIGAQNLVYRGAVADALCEPGVTCFDYTIETLAPAWRLRVAGDAPWKGEPEYDVSIVSPTGARATSTWSYGGTIPPRSQEAFIDASVPGTYAVRIVVYFANNLDLRLRAMLEESPATGSGDKLPDLRAEPPFAFGFGAAGVLNVPIRCYPDEELVDGASRCLRFSFGWQNVGDGPMDLRFMQPTVEAAGEARLGGPVAQRIHGWDGSYRDRPGAGDYEWHASHHHYHYVQFFEGRLYRVADPDAGILEPAGEFRKLGGCSHDWKITEWSRFVQSAAGNDSGAACGMLGLGTPTQTHITLSAGWLDVYQAGTPDNYVEFGVNEDGLYVIRVMIDPENGLDEWDESNNRGYALVRIEGDAVTLIERGQGLDPWDPAKVVFPDQLV